MRIETTFEWWNAAAQASDMLGPYLARFGIRWNRERFFQLRHNGAFDVAWLQFQEAWEALPDKPEIRTGPFFLLCDVCSEGMQFLEDEPGAIERSVQHVTANNPQAKVTRF